MGRNLIPELSLWASFCCLLAHPTNPTTTSTTYHHPVFRKSFIWLFLQLCLGKLLPLYQMSEGILLFISDTVTENIKHSYYHCITLLNLSNYRKYKCKGYTTLGIATMKNSMDNAQKIKNRTTIWSSNLTSGYISKKMKTGFQ